MRIRLAAWLAQYPGIRAALANSGWLIVDRVARMVLALLVGAWVARHLGPGRYGELSYVVAVVAFWQAAAGLGLESLVVRDLAHARAPAGSLLGTVLRVRLGAALLGWLGVVATVALLAPEGRMPLLVALVLGGGLVFQVADIVDQWFQSRSESRRTVAPRLAAYTAGAALKVALILADAPLWAFATALLCDAVFAAAALAWVYRRRPVPLDWRHDAALARALLRESWPLMLAGLSVAAYTRIDQVILRTLTNEAELGLYSAVLPLSQAFHMLPMAVCASVLPRLATLKGSDPARCQIRMQQLFSAMAWSGAAVALLTAVAAPWLVGLLLGPAYAKAVPVLQWHALTNVFVFLGVAQSVAITGDATPKIALYRTLIGAVVSAAANLLLVPRWGALGAAWAACAAQFAAAVLSNAVLARPYLRMQVRAIWPFHAH